MSAYPKIERLMRKGITILQDEKRAILAADYSALETLNTRKEAVAGEINTLAARLPRSEGDIWRELRALADILSRRAEENQSLLVAAQEGVAEARRRIEIVLGPGAGMGVYDARGTRVQGDNPKAQSFTF